MKIELSKDDFKNVLLSLQLARLATGLNNEFNIELINLENKLRYENQECFKD